MPAPLHILHICSGNLYGGVESVILSLLDPRHRRLDLRQTCAYCFSGRFTDGLTAHGAETHCLGAVRLRNPFSIWKARARLRRLLATQCFDAAICHSFWTLLLFGSLVPRSPTKLVFWLHDVPAGEKWFRTLTGVIERAARRICPALIICNSKFVSGLAGLLYPGVERCVVYCPVDAHAIDPAMRQMMRKRYQVPHGRAIIIQVGRMEPWKGHRQHLEALAGLCDIPGWECWIVGGAQRDREARYLTQLQAFVQSHGLGDRVRFLGQRDDVPALLAAADLLCQPNTAPEPFGVVFVEALAAGLPVVTSRMGGAIEIVDETCGVLVEPGDTAQLRRNLLRLIQDRETREWLGANGPSRARQISDPAETLARLLARLLAKLQAAISASQTPEPHSGLVRGAAQGGARSR